MSKWATVSGLILIGGIVAAAISDHTLYAADKKEVYVPPGAQKQALVNEPLRGADGQQITIDHYSLPPGWVGGRHYHSGPVYVYVLEGSFIMDEQGKPTQTLGAGSVYKEPIGTPMQARNLSTSEPLKILVIQVTPKGEALMYKAE